MSLISKKNRRDFHSFRSVLYSRKARFVYAIRQAVVHILTIEFATKIYNICNFAGVSITYKMQSYKAALKNTLRTFKSLFLTSIRRLVLLGKRLVYKTSSFRALLNFYCCMKFN